MMKTEITDKIISPDSFFIEKMQLSEILDVAHILTDAFETNPAYSIIFDKAKNPKDGLLWLFKANLFLLNRRQTLTNVIKEYRGLGVGSYAINNCLNELSSKKDCCPIGLTTQLPENVTFYSRLGFEKMDEGEIYFKKSHYYNYNMIYKLCYETK